MTAKVKYSKGYLTPEGGFTVECWFWRDAPPVVDYAALFAQRDQAKVQWFHPAAVLAEGRHIWFGFAPTTGAFHLSTINTGGTNELDYVDASPTGYEGDSQWHHVAVSLDAETRKTFTIYLDGEFYDSETLGSEVSWNSGRFNIAGTWWPERGNLGQHAYDKRMAYFAIFDHQLTANRIQEHYTAGSGGTVYYADDEVERLNRIYEWAGVPENYRVSDAAVSELQGIQVADSNALTSAQETAEFAGGYVFANGQSAMVYHNRKHRYNQLASMIVQESSGSSPEVGIKFSTNEAFIFNDIRGERPFGGQVRLINQPSIDTHGRKVTSFKISITDPEELKNAVAWMLGRYGEDRVRISGATFSCATSQQLKKIAYGHLEIGDLLVIDELQDPAPVSRMEFIIEGIAVEADFLGKTWDVTLQLSPNELFRVFEIGTTALGSTDYIAY